MPPKQPPPSTPPAAYQSLIDPLIRAAKEILESGTRFLPIAYIGNFESKKIIAIDIDTDSEISKDQSAKGMKLAAESINADFVFTIMEVWALREDKVPQSDQIIERYGSVSASPYAVDAISFTLETKYGLWVAQMQIKPKGISKKKRTFANPIFRMYTSAKGRFAEILTKDSDIATTLH